MAQEVTKATSKSSTNPTNAIRREHEIRVYQIASRDQESVNAMFTSWDRLKRYGIKFDPSRYKSVYNGKMNVKDLDDAYAQLQGQKPDGYKGHSLSVSDVVVMDGKAYFVDDFGFRKLRNKMK